MDLTRGLYTNTMSAVRIYCVNAAWFSTESAVRQGCALSPNLVLLPLDKITKRVQSTKDMWVHTLDWRCSQIWTPDDVALLAEILENLVRSIEMMDRVAHPFRIGINWAKKRYKLWWKHGRAGWRFNLP